MRTQLLQRAIAAMENLPEELQDAIAERMLEEVADEQAWNARFEATSDAQWSQLAETVRRSIRDGSTTPLEDVLPPRSPA
jgi:hypothetical protein